VAATRKKSERTPATRRPAPRKASAAPKVAVRKPAIHKAPARRKAPAKSKPALERRIVRGSIAAKSMRLAGVGSDAVLKATGRAWEEWIKLLDRAGAKALPHKDIALMLSRKFEVPNWWSQMVTVGYEQARGLRVVNQKTDGFVANASRTVATPLDNLYNAWSDPQVRARWLLDAPVEVRRSTDGKSIRMTWTAGNSSVDVGFYPKGPGKSMVAIQHGKLPKAADATRQKAFWSEALERLKALLEPPAVR
jgi:uncharacterized protein YndB with AHSA1/START domain